VSGDFVKSLLKGIDPILKIREDIGANLAEIFLITRCWSGDQPGSGKFKDTEKRISPTPGIKDFSHDIRLDENAGVQQGDIILTNISKRQFPSESDIDTKSDDRSVEKAYKLVNRSKDEKFYTVVSIKEKQLTWDLQIRRISSEDIWSGQRVV